MGVLDLFKLDGKVALVTGGGQGFGRGYALALAEAGADVAVADLNEKTGRSVVKEIEALGRRSIFVETDVTSEGQVNAMVDTTVKKLGDLDIGVNNAGGGRMGPAETYKVEDWDFVMNLNLKSVFLCCKAEAQVMIKKLRGKIINTASMSGTIANAGISYNTSKAGVVMLTKTLAAEWGKYNINVNSISPSYALTPMLRRTPKERRDKMRSLHPMGWFERPEDLYGTIVYLASDASNYVTGRDIMVDGGHTLNVWINPPERVAPPLITREEEIKSLKHDLDVLGIKYNEDGITTE